MQLALCVQQISEWLAQANRWLKEVAMQYGYPGIFVVSVIGASSVIIPIPYTLLIFYMGKILNPVFVALSSGAGSAIGEFVGYVLGYFGRAAISDERKRKMNHVLKIFRRHGAITIFLFSLTPLPDDLLLIPLGIMRYSFLKAIVPCIIGKMLMSLIIAYAGYMSIGFIEAIFGESGGLWTIIATTILLVVIVAVMLRVDWEKVFPLGEKEEKNDEEKPS